MLFISILLISSAVISVQGLGLNGDGEDGGDFANGDKVALIEIVEPWAMQGPMIGYNYDLYQAGPDGMQYVPPPLFDYQDPIELDYPVLKELKIATDEIDPASRETTIELILTRTPITAAPTTPVSIQYGQFLPVRYELTPATKTVILEGGTATAEVYVLPEAVDLYVAFKTGSGAYYFVDSNSSFENRFYRRVKPFTTNQPITLLRGVIGAYMADSKIPAGIYSVRAVMVPPGADVRNEANWISNLAVSNFRLGIIY